MILDADGVVCRLGEPLSAHTAWRTGGPCDAWLVVHRREGLLPALSWCRDQSLRVTPLGAGTRVVVRDGGLAGAVLRLGADFCSLEASGAELEVGAALPLPALLARCARLGLSGVEELARVPGSVGASLVLDEWPQEVLSRVYFVHRGKIRHGTPRQARRRLVIGARLVLRPDRPEAVSERLARALHKSRQPLPSSWYEGRGVKKALGKVQLPQVRLRRVAIPDTAPELLVNLGGGTASDLALLHRSALERVRRLAGAELSSRVTWVGSHRRES